NDPPAESPRALAVQRPAQPRFRILVRQTAAVGRRHDHAELGRARRQRDRALVRPEAREGRRREAHAAAGSCLKNRVSCAYTSGYSFLSSFGVSKNSSTLTAKNSAASS